MSLGRSYDILRAYVGREWERIKGVEDTMAEKELYSWELNPVKRSSSTSPTQDVPAADNSKLAAARFLGVEEGCPFEVAREAFERLNERSDPSKFPSDSTEYRQAEQIQRRVQWAYKVLTQNVDATEKRFKSLELD